jgi:hypothetical protein
MKEQTKITAFLIFDIFVIAVIGFFFVTTGNPFQFYILAFYAFFKCVAHFGAMLGWNQTTEFLHELGNKMEEIIERDSEDDE